MAVLFALVIETRVTAMKTVELEQDARPGLAVERDLTIEHGPAHTKAREQTATLITV